MPFHTTIDPSCDHGLRELERLGVKVERSVGASAIDIVRNLLASDALDQGYESLLFIDADIAFHPEDAIKILRHPEPVVAGVYASKVIGRGQVNCRFAPLGSCQRLPASGSPSPGGEGRGEGPAQPGAWADASEGPAYNSPPPESPPEGGVASGETEAATNPKVRFGDWGGLYPLEAVGAGFLRIKTDVLRQMILKLELPVCRMAGRYAWPFFLPVVVEEEGEVRYLGEDYAFCWRCRQIGVPVLADTTIRLMHMGSYPYGWEEAGGEHVARYRNLECDFKTPRPVAPAPRT